MRRTSSLYRLALGLAERVAPLAARVDSKIARGIEGRRGLLERLERWAGASRDPARPLVWVHAPSVGEALQAKPVLEALRADRPEWQLAFTYFSPSAERLARSLPVDVADYAPFDRPGPVARALELLSPRALVFSKLDVWPELTLAAAARGVRLGLISGTVAPKSSRLSWPSRSFTRPAYHALDRIGAISDEDGRRLARLGARRDAITVTGDTRYDSVAERAARCDTAREPLATLAQARTETFTVVAGSTWPGDETVLLAAFADLRQKEPRTRLVIAPHEPHPDHLAGIAAQAAAAGLPRPVRLSQLDRARDAAVIVVDRVGILADLYALADAAHVGGGFHRAGLHSVLEPAVLGVPVTFGPRWTMSRDAGILLARGGAVALPADGRNALHAQWLVWLHDAGARGAAGKIGRAVVEAGRGASERTTKLVMELVEKA
ncbi:MAG TPA: glycosyltransferase N-terminal domain-containing protein [Gemmatimonadales bacterium]|nr:glycosyltransferase N-terminal domain-containing protein [Gemmatimonadales bacterium]